MNKALLFDMDGLIFDTEGMYKKAWQEAAAEQGLELTDEYYQNFIGTQDPECERLMVTKFGDALDLIRYRKVVKALLCDERAKGIAFKPGFHQLFSLAREQSKLCALVTSSHLPEVQHHFDGSGYLEQFDTLVTAEDVENGKPQPDCYLMACEKLGIAPAHALVLEDSNNGMQAALDAGCVAAMVPDILPPRDDIAARAHYILGSLDEACAIISPE